MKRFLLAALLSLLCAPAIARPSTSAPGVSIADVTVNESAGTATLTITKSIGKSYSKISVTTADRTAIAGLDYQTVSQQLTMGSTQTSSTVTVPIINDSVYESSETFSVSVRSVRNATIVRSPATVTITDDDLASIPPPPPPPPAPAPGLTGETAILDNFDTTQGIELTFYGPNGRGGTPPISADPVGAYRMFCKPGPMSHDDPLLYPGVQNGSAHWHQFFGNTGTNYASNYSSLRTTGATTCGNRDDAAHPLNRSSYWMPAMLDGVGNAVKPDYMNLYYKRNPASDPYCSLSSTSHIGQCTDLPNGIRFVFGYNMKTMTGGPSDLSSQDSAAITFQCWNSFDETTVISPAKGYYHSIEEVRQAGCPVGARLMIVAAAPICWDGSGVDSADHRSHMHHADGAMYVGQFFRACPSTHPYLIPSLEVQVAYTTDANFTAGKWQLDSDRQMAVTMGHAVTPGSTWHMDYWEAWSPTVKATWHRTCINQHLSCAGGDLGDGTEIKQSDHYPNSDFPTHVLVPVP
jgi:hypothetical protein